MKQIEQKIGPDDDWIWAIIAAVFLSIILNNSL